MTKIRFTPEQFVPEGKQTSHTQRRALRRCHSIWSISVKSSIHFLTYLHYKVGIHYEYTVARTFPCEMKKIIEYIVNALELRYPTTLAPGHFAYCQVLKMYSISQKIYYRIILLI